MGAPVMSYPNTLLMCCPTGDGAAAAVLVLSYVGFVLPPGSALLFSPLVVGVGIGENFLASDQMALRQVTDRFIYLEEGDMVRITPSSLQVFDREGSAVERQKTRIDEAVETVEMGDFDHYMIKEIYEQPRALAATLLVSGLLVELKGTM